MTCLFLDPCGPYPVRLLEALAARQGKALALFTSPARLGVWRHKWVHQLGQHVVGERLLEPATDLAALARSLRADWPEISGIVPWDEENVVVGAELAEHLGLEWCAREVVERCRDKGRLKRWLRTAAPDLRLNGARIVNDRSAALSFAEEIGCWPLVVKPTAGSGSEHVFFAGDPGELLYGCQRVLESGAGEVLIEEYVGGRELAVNGQTDGAGEFRVTDVWLYDRRDSHGAANLYYEAARVASVEPLFAEVASYGRRVIEALGLRRCPVHMEVKVDERGPCLIEVGSRFGGISLPVLASRLQGRDLFAVALRHYLAADSHRPEDFDLAAYDRSAARVLLGIQSQPLSRIERLEGSDEVEKLSSFAGWGLLRPAGSPAPRTADLESRAWELLLVHSVERQLAADAVAARRLLRYVGNG